MLIRLCWAEMVEVVSKSWRRKSRLELGEYVQINVPKQLTGGVL